MGVASEPAHGSGDGGAARNASYETPTGAAPGSCRAPARTTSNGLVMNGITPEQAIVLDDDDDDNAPAASSKKRKAPTYELITPYEPASPPAKKQKPPPEEKRQRIFRHSPPQTFTSVYRRALSQRFYVLTRTRCGTEECPEESVEMTGSTGNIYTVHVGKVSTCTCPHARQGNQCKHVIYVMSRVLNAPFNFVYQLALLSSELCAIFASAPAIASPTDAGANSKNRKEVCGDCPICFSELDAKSPESVVWCRAACGQNIHQECFEMWARTKGVTEVTCPFCRSPWQGDEDVVAKLVKNKVGEEGYVNVADQLGISSARDESSYSSWYNYPRRRRNRWY